MSEIWISLSLLLPLVGAVLVRVGSAPKQICGLMLSIFALPALISAFSLPTETSLDLPWLLFGTSLHLSETSRPFLLFTSLLWTLAGWFSAIHLADDKRLRSYTTFFLLSFAGNISIFFARDVPLFYSGFAVMTFAAYGLIVHTRSEDSLRAGRLYIGMAVAGEVLVLAGLIGLVHAAGTSDIAAIRPALSGSPHLPWISALLLAGFGAKAGLIPLHAWLPLAHPAAPAGASAVLSGAMIKAGLFGWITFLPAGLSPLPQVGNACMILGLFAALVGAVAALTQTRPKANLAYSSISQMGLMTMAIGMGLSHPKLWPAAVMAVSFYAFTHAFAKGALFMAAGAVPVLDRTNSKIMLAGAALTSLVIAGAPLTGGEVGKKMIKKLTAYPSGSWTDHLDLWLAGSTLLTTLLLARLIQLLYKTRPEKTPAPSRKSNGMTLMLIVSTLAALMAPRFLAETAGLDVKFPVFSIKGLQSAWPIALGLAISPLILWIVERAPKIPTGDLGLLYLTVASKIAYAWRTYAAPNMERMRPGFDQSVKLLMHSDKEEDGWADIAERKLRSMPGAGVVLFAVVLCIWWSLQS